MPQQHHYAYSVQPCVEDDTRETFHTDGRGVEDRIWSVSMHSTGWFQLFLVMSSFVGGMLLGITLHGIVGERCLRVGSDSHGIPPKLDDRPLPIMMDHHAPHHVTSETFESPVNLNDTIHAWNRLGPPGAFVRLFDDEISRGISPIEFATPSGPLHAVQVTGIHQVHCLTTLLRDYGLLLMGYSWDELYDHLTIEEMRGHMAHCFNTILLGLTCLADASTIGGVPGSLAADYERTTHMCNDYNALLGWAMDPARVI